MHTFYLPKFTPADHYNPIRAYQSVRAQIAIGKCSDPFPRLAPAAIDGASCQLPAINHRINSISRSPPPAHYGAGLVL